MKISRFRMEVQPWIEKGSVILVIEIQVSNGQCLRFEERFPEDHFVPLFDCIMERAAKALKKSIEDQDTGDASVEVKP